MWTAAQIRRYVSRLPFRQLFTTRDLLNCGSRAAVDQTLSRLVKGGYIQRVARGVFARIEPGTEIVFPVLAVAKIKAESFGRRLISHAADVAHHLGLTSASNQQPTFSINSRSSSFKFGDKVIHLRECSARKMHLADRNPGLFIRALWHLGRTACTLGAIAIAGSCLERSDRSELRMRAAFMPAWLKQTLERPSNRMFPPSPEQWHQQW